MRVKILFNKKENALVQMSDSTQAQLGKLLHMLLWFLGRLAEHRNLSSVLHLCALQP